MRRIKAITLVLAAATLAAGCGDEDPVSTGAELLGETLRTVHVVLDASQFLQADTTYDQIGSLNDASFGILANDFADGTDARVLFQINRPSQVTYEDSDGDRHTDSVQTIIGAKVTVVVDTLTEVEGPLELSVSDLTESWDPGSASWTHRVDTAGTSEPWSTPGGTLGSVRGTDTWNGGDTVVISIDSASAAVWHESAAARRGAALSLGSANARLRVESVEFAYEIVPESTPDTVVPGGSISNQVTVATPDADPGNDLLQVGGLPVWRSALKFRPLADVPVPCSNTATSCTIKLSQVTVTAANLLLTTRAAGGRRPERGMRIESRAILQGPGVPLTRSPMTAPQGRTNDAIATSAFSAPAARQIRVPITGYVQKNVSASEDDTPVLWLALVALPERALFGYGEFGALASADPPRLELVVTVPAHQVE